MNEREEAELEEGEKLLKECCAKLSEHWENVQIMVSRINEGGETFTQMTHGLGHWHARQNQAREWVLLGEEIMRVKARDCARRSINEPLTGESPEEVDPGKGE